VLYILGMSDYWEGVGEIYVDRAGINPLLKLRKENLKVELAVVPRARLDAYKKKRRPRCSCQCQLQAARLPLACNSTRNITVHSQLTGTPTRITTYRSNAITVCLQARLYVTVQINTHDQSKHTLFYTIVF
jgi:hypothetical protein